MKQKEEKSTTLIKLIADTFYITFLPEAEDKKEDRKIKDQYLTLLEKYINENYMKIPSTERSTKVNTLKDEKIEKITEILGVNRSNVHFIENYHSENKKANSIEIDYQLLKTMNDIITSGELFIMNYLNKQREQIIKQRK